MTLTFGSLFSGIGGFDLGFERAGMKCIWQCEIDKNCQQVLTKQFGVKIYDDVRAIGKGNAESVDVICGGFPCQDVSIAGKRAGLVGERSGLWYEFARIIDELEPKWVIIENVPGLLSSNKGRDFAVIIRWLVERGYGVSWRILDSQYFGVAQRRRRVFIVASFGNGRSAEVLFESDGMCWDPPARSETGKAIAGAVAPSLTSSNNPSRSPQSSEITQQVNAILEAGTFTVRSGKEGGGKGYLGQESLAMTLGGQEQYLEETYSLTLANTNRNGPYHATNIAQTIDTWGAQAVTNRMTAFGEYVDDDKASSLKSLDFKDATDLIVLNDQGGSQMSVTNDVTATLRSQEHGHQPILWQLHNHDASVRVQTHGTTPTISQAFGTGGNNVPFIGVRRLTPTECARLQGFPDDWNDFLSDSSRYKQFGNAVTVNVAQWIAERIVAS